MRYATILLLSLASTIQAQTWTDVAAPTYAPIYVELQTNTVWRLPLDAASPAGVYEVSNAIVDRSHQIGAWSQPATITVKAGWRLRGGTWNQAVTNDDIGIVWKVKCINVVEDAPFLNGSEHHFCDNFQPYYTVSPYSSDCPEGFWLWNLWQKSREFSNLRFGGRNTIVAPPPKVFGSSFPYKKMQVAYCRVTEKGETALSPPLTVTPPAKTFSKQPEVGTLLIRLTNDPHPQGTIGCHFYVRFDDDGGEWHRVQAPHCYGYPTTADDWLFQVNDNQIELSQLYPNAPTHHPVAQPQSRLNDLQLMLKNTKGSIVVPPAQEYICTCPVIDEYGPGNNKSGRRISSADGGRWKMTQQASLGGETYWPMLLVYNQYSTWEYANINGLKGASAGITYAGWSGGQSFFNTFSECWVNVSNGSPYFTCGLLIWDRGSRWFGDHTASEQTFRSCRFDGTVAAYLQGNQTADVRFDGCSFGSYGDRRGSTFYVDTSAPINFTNGTYCGSPSGVVFRCNFANLNVGDIWVDQGFSHFIDSRTNGQIKARFLGGKLNAWGMQPNLTRLIEQGGKCDLFFSNVNVQMNQAPYNLIANSGQTNLLDLRFDSTKLDELVMLREPTEQESRDMWAKLRGGAPFPTPLAQGGYRLTIPGKSVTIPGMTIAQKINNSKATTTITIPEKTVTLQDQVLLFNSITGRQTVRRADWWSIP